MNLPPQSRGPSEDADAASCAILEIAGVSDLRARVACVLWSPSMREQVVYRPQALPVKRDVPKFP